MSSTSNQTLKESRLFEFYASTIWPIHRLLARKYLTPRCRRCVISANASPLNHNGICALCTNTNTDTTYEISPEKQQALTEELDSVIRSYVGKGQAYDALVMISGGKDSALLIHELKTRYPELRLLTLTVDNSFMSPVALSNTAKLIKQFSVPHVLFRPSPAFYQKAFAYAFTHPKGLGCAQTVDTIDGEVFVDVGRNIAAKFKIPLLIPGFSFEQVVRYLHWDTFYNDVVDTTPRTMVGVYTKEELSGTNDAGVWWNPTSYPGQPIPRLICPFYVWRWNELEIQDRIAKLGLLSRQKTSPLVTNSALIPLCGLVDSARLGYSSWEPEFSRMVREGKTDAGHWRNIFELIEYSYKTGHFISKSVDEVLAQLGLTRAEVGIVKK